MGGRGICCDRQKRGAFERKLRPRVIPVPKKQGGLAAHGKSLKGRKRIVEGRILSIPDRKRQLTVCLKPRERMLKGSQHPPRGSRGEEKSILGPTKHRLAKHPFPVEKKGSPPRNEERRGVFQRMRKGRLLSSRSNELWSGKARTTKRKKAPYRRPCSGHPSTERG